MNIVKQFADQEIGNRGAVIIHRDSAIQYLKDTINYLLDNTTEVEGAPEMVQDLTESIFAIENHDWKWVVIEQNPMTVSELTVREAKI